MSRETTFSRASLSAFLRGRTIQWSRRTSDPEDHGFTLIELLIVVTIIPIIVGALAAGLITVFSLQGSVSARLGDSSDSQVVAASFTKDVQSASSIETSGATPLCGPTSETELVGLVWGNSLEVVSYVEQLQNGSTYSLIRNECDNGTSTTPTRSTTLAYDLLPPCLSGANPCQAPPSVYNQTGPYATVGSPVSTIGVTSVQFSITEPKSSYQYQLSATPAGGSSTKTSNLGFPDLTDPSCGFALPGTGQYASRMCFIGFSTDELQAAYPNAGNTCKNTDPGQQGIDTTVAVPGGFFMKFCLTVVPGAGENQNGTPVIAVSTPVGGGTCDEGTPCDGGDISNGQGFLGNDNEVNGTNSAAPFYAGIGCLAGSTLPTQNGVVTSSCIDPAIFQTTNGGTDTVTLSNIVVDDTEGNTATGYEVITADAETIDPGGDIIWTSSLPAAKPLTFGLVPNFTYSDLGNACNEVPAGYTGAAGWAIDNGDTTQQIPAGGPSYTGGLTGLGTNTVECQSNWQTGAPYLRTGTAMIGLTPPSVNGGGAEPVTISAQLKGEGYNAVAFGLLLS
ncbi:MAG: prepilin-type N-terminal cleavage/methylation domain-containing protein [Acidimicrobiales bacterium]